MEMAKDKEGRDDAEGIGGQLRRDQPILIQDGADEGMEWQTKPRKEKRLI